MKNLSQAPSFQKNNQRIFKHVREEEDLILRVQELKEALKGEKEAERMLVVQARELRNQVATLIEENKELEAALELATSSEAQ